MPLENPLLRSSRVVEHTRCAKTPSPVLSTPPPPLMPLSGCNECTVVLNTPTGIYASFVLTVVAEEDQSRVLWPSCPSYGWANGVNRLR